MGARDTRSAIRAAALRLFLAKGVEQTSLREVADEVGITKASLYYHYESKADLLAAVVAPVLFVMRDVVDGLSGTPHDQDAVRELLRRYLVGLLNHRAEGSLFVRDAAAMSAALESMLPELMDLSNRLHAWLAGPSATAEDTIRAIAAVQVLGTALTADTQVPDASDGEIEAVLLDAAMNVLRPGTIGTEHWAPIGPGSTR
ncbi:TetR/AcrR family transcriptional regulator [Rhodococcus sp. NPDC059234]|uniref:TetR/AcrR family transcriptional regulator n=1 Tax=Rhodococcus sp. NPDC059234 TaxID=3346781 RepID=UPI00366BBA1E